MKLSLDEKKDDWIGQMSQFVLTLAKDIKSKDLDLKIMAASYLKEIYKNLLILKNSKNPIWAEKEGQEAVNNWLNLIKKIVEEA